MNFLIPDKITDNEIAKALECCMNEKTCKNCAYNGRPCMTPLKRDALDLINRLQEENERLLKECGNQSTLWSNHFESIFETAKETIKAEARKEFAERLLSCYEGFDKTNEVILFENLVKAIEDTKRELEKQ